MDVEVHKSMQKIKKIKQKVKRKKNERKVNSLTAKNGDGNDPSFDMDKKDNIIRRFTNIEEVCKLECRQLINKEVWN